MTAQHTRQTDLATNQAADDPHDDGIDRRGFLKCMAWVGTGVIWSLSGGILTSCGLNQAKAQAQSDFSFIQISDSHIGFKNEPNQDVTATLQQAIGKVNSLTTPLAFMLHTGDLSHLSKPEEFDTVEQTLKSTRAGQVFYVPGEHDVFNDNGKYYLDRYGKGTVGQGWRSFDYHGVHFIGLVNVLNLKAGGLGTLGQEQLDWLKKDVASLSSSVPIVVYAHIPLWTVYPQWGWGTDDSEQALALLKRFGSVTVLNGHIHQVLQKIEGNVTFHTALSTAFPQPAPGAAPAPGPLKVPADKLKGMLGVRDVHYVVGKNPLAIVDTTLG
jgi:3',5'-cyclic-AMP phosphodiesterase